MESMFYFKNVEINEDIFASFIEYMKDLRVRHSKLIEVLCQTQLVSKDIRQGRWGRLAWECEEEFVRSLELA